MRIERATKVLVDTATNEKDFPKGASLAIVPLSKLEWWDG